MIDLASHSDQVPQCVVFSLHFKSCCIGDARILNPGHSVEGESRHLDSAESFQTSLRASRQHMFLGMQFSITRQGEVTFGGQTCSCWWIACHLLKFTSSCFQNELLLGCSTVLGSLLANRVSSTTFWHKGCKAEPKENHRLLSVENEST